MPPVTALRSPPDSRITGALSPVITDSSTVAMPSITSPSPGNQVARVARSRCRRRAAAKPAPARSCRERQAASPATSVLVLRSASACALPRASAIASAKFANSTVNQSHSEIWIWNPIRRAPVNDVADQEHRGQRRAHLDHEHHRILQQRDRVQLDERCPRSPARRSPGRTAGATAPASSAAATSDRPAGAAASVSVRVVKVDMI